MLDLDVILAAHGAGNDSPANERVLECARHLEQTLVGARVTAAFNVGEPSHFAAIASANRAHQVVIPLLTSDGLYASRLRQDVERTRIPGRSTTVLPPVGTHHMVIQSIADRIAALVASRKLDVRNSYVIVVGHGTARHPGSDSATLTIANAITRRGPTKAFAAFLDASPTIEEVIEAAVPNKSVIIVPFLLGGGDHARNDVPLRVSASASRRGVPHDRITFLEPLGSLATLCELLELLVRETRTGRVLLNVGARASLLSLRQVELFAARMAPRGADIRFIPLETGGDRDLTNPISALGDDCFVDDVNHALRTGRIDVAIHSLKDLPLAGDADIISAAVLPRASAGEVLVSRTGANLASLPAASKVGASCVRRTSQLRQLRPDLVVAPIRGAVPNRIAAVDRDEFAAIVLAAAGLERLSLTSRIAERFSLREFVPAPAQGAIVVQCMATSTHLPLLQTADDRLTHCAVLAELAFARVIVESSNFVPAAFAVADSSGILLQARLIDADSNRTWDLSLHGTDAEQLGVRVAQELLEMSVVKISEPNTVRRGRESSSGARSEAPR